jgi:hypothetical protein
MIQFYWLQNKELFIVFLSAVEGLAISLFVTILLFLKKNNKDFHCYRGWDFKFPTFLSSDEGGISVRLATQ